MTSSAQRRLIRSGSMPKVEAAASSRILYADEGLVTAEIGRSCVAIWQAAPDEFLFERQRSSLVKVIESHSVPVGFLCVVLANAPPPSDNMRKASVEMLQEFKANLACVAGVIESQGFRSAITRSVLSGMAFLLARDFQVKFAGSVEHAAAWMGQFTHIGPVDAYKRAIDTCRALLPPL